MNSHPPPLASRLRELRRRKLAQWLIAYCAGAWAFLEVFDFLATSFGWPKGLVRSITVIFGVGIIIVLVLAWFHGEKGAQRASHLEVGLLAGLLVIAGIGAVAVRRTGAGGTTEPALAEPPGPPVPGSVAVLPFHNLGGHAEEEYFADGFTEELLNALQNAGLRVPGRSSAFAFKGRAADTRSVARMLSVTHVLEGSIRRAGRRVRISVQLADGADGLSVWSRTFDRDVSELASLGVQEEIARAIGDVLRLRLLPRGAGRGGTSRPAAYEAYLRGVVALAPHTDSAFVRAAAEFERAIRLDSAFARAHSAFAFATLLHLQTTRATPQLRDVALRAALRARELDSLLAEPHVVLGALAQRARDGAGARAHLDEAVRKEPQSRWARYYSAMAYFNVCDRQGAFSEAERLLEVDPLSPTAHLMAGNVMNWLGHYARADSLTARGARMDSAGMQITNKWSPYWNRGFAQLMGGHYAQAAALFETSDRLYGDSVAGQAVGEAIRALARARQPTATADARRAAVETLTGLEPSLLGAGYNHDHDMLATVFYLLLEEHERMYAVMHRIVNEGRWFAATWAVFDSVRRDPRFIEIARQLRLPPACIDVPADTSALAPNRSQVEL